MSDGFKAAVIGCGKRGHLFADGCAAAGAQLVGFCDIRLDAAEALVEKYAAGRAFSDVAAMLEATRPDFVCIVTRPAVRLEPIVACARGQVKGVICEKPMALSMGEARAAHAAAVEAGMQLSFCHQRRFVFQFAKARQLIADGAIGKLLHVEGYSDNFFDWATHWFDQFFYWNDETPAEWVLAAADFTGGKTVFDVPIESAHIATVKYANGVFGQLHGGEAQPLRWLMRAQGEAGQIEVAPGSGLPLKLRRWSAGEEQMIAPPGQQASDGMSNAIGHAIECLRTRQEPLISSRRALAATELIFASLLSASQGGRVKVPLGPEADNRPIAGFFDPR